MSDCEDDNDSVNGSNSAEWTWTLGDHRDQSQTDVQKKCVYRQSSVPRLNTAHQCPLLALKSLTEKRDIGSLIQIAVLD